MCLGKLGLGERCSVRWVAEIGVVLIRGGANPEPSAAFFSPSMNA